MSIILPPLIGVSGYKFAGKNTAAECLELLGYKLRAFADPLKELAIKSGAKFRVNVDWYTRQIMPAGTEGSGYPWGTQLFPLSEIVEALGWDEAKKYPEIRAFLQNLGNGAREVIYEEIWVEASLRELDTTKNRYGFTDVRYPNEIELAKGYHCTYDDGPERIHHERGILLWIDREGCESDGHASESGIARERADHILSNNGSKLQLWESIYRLLGVPYSTDGHTITPNLDALEIEL